MNTLASIEKAAHAAIAQDKKGIIGPGGVGGEVGVGTAGGGRGKVFSTIYFSLFIFS